MYIENAFSLFIFHYRNVYEIHFFLYILLRDKLTSLNIRIICDSDAVCPAPEQRIDNI